MREIDIDKTKLSIQRNKTEDVKPVSLKMRAKLSEYYTENLTKDQHDLAKFLIQTTVRINLSLGVNPLFIAKTDGRFYYQGEWRAVSPKGYSTSAASIGEIICEAIRSGLVHKTGIELDIKNYMPVGNDKPKLPIEELRYTNTKLLENEEDGRLNTFHKVIANYPQAWYRNFRPDGEISNKLSLIRSDILEPNAVAEKAKREKERKENQSKAQREREEVREKQAELKANKAREEEQELLKAQTEAQEREEQLERERKAIEEAPDDEWLNKKFAEIREYLRSDTSEQHDVVSTATYKFAGRMLKIGLPREAVLHAYALTWSQHVRDELEIPSFDPMEYGESKNGQHRAIPYIEKLVEGRIPTLMVGPTQAGKGFIARNIAENRGLQFGSVPLSAGTSIAWLFGRNMPQGHVKTDFLRCYKDGGVYLLDEMDAADSNLLIGINDALSNYQLANPVVDERIDKHKDFIPLAAANTWGLGADADYTGRERLDMATLERWRMGRVLVDYDIDLQEKILRIEAGSLDK